MNGATTLNTMPTYKSYIIGFIASLALTLGAYFVVTNHVVNAAAIILVLALAQLLVQLIYFLHLGKGEDGHWNVIALLSTFSIIAILVVGSVWIIGHLNHNMTQDQMMQYMMKSEGMHSNK
jgi:cytochrome o ubiquinol oxidase operon protein cyoD